MHAHLSLTTCICIYTVLQSPGHLGCWPREVLPGWKVQSNITFMINSFKGKRREERKKHAVIQKLTAGETLCRWRKYYNILALIWTHSSVHAFAKNQLCCINGYFKANNIQPGSSSQRCLMLSPPPTDCRSWQAGHSSSLTTAASEDSVDAASSVAEAASRLRDFAAATVYFYVVLTRFELREDEAASGNSSWQMQAWFVRAH